MIKRKLWMCADIELEMKPDETQKQATDRMCVTLDKAGVNLVGWETSQVIETEVPDEPMDEQKEEQKEEQKPADKLTALQTLLRLLKGGKK